MAVLEQEDEVWTDERLMSLPDWAKRVQVVNRRLSIMAPTGAEHGGLGSRLLIALGGFVEMHQLGVVFDSSTGFRMQNRNFYSPDLAFVAAARLKGLRRLPRKPFEGAPDLAIEILSPDDTVREAEAKLAEYFANGTRLAWLVHPESQTVTLYRAAKPAAVLSANDVLTGEDVVPGFVYPLAKLFAELHF